MIGDLRALAIGSHVFAAVAGVNFTVPAPGVVSALALPDPDDAVWTELTKIEEWEDKVVNEDEKIIYDPAPGVLVASDTVQIKQSLQCEFKGNRIASLAIQAMYRTALLDRTSVSYVPMSSPPPKCWLKFQRYDQDGNLNQVMDLWGRLKLKGGWKGGDIIRPEFEFLVLYSALNLIAQ